MSKVMLSIVSFVGVVRVITQRSAGWKVAWQHLKWLQRRLYFPLINFLMGWWQPQTLMNMLSESPLERYSLGLGFGLSFKPFAPELPLTALADPAPFYRLWRHQFQMPRTLYPLPWVGWRDISNHTTMSTRQSRRPEKKKKKRHVTLT